MNRNGLTSVLELDLLFELFDLLAQLVDDLLVHADVDLDLFFVLDDLSLDLFCAESVFESILGFLDGVEGGRDTGDHDCFGVAAEGIFEEAGEFGVSVGDKRAFFVGVGEEVDAVSETEETFVDIGALLLAESLVFGGGCTFGAGQVDHDEFGGDE